MGVMESKVQKVLAAHLDAGDPVQLLDYGTLQGSGSEAKAAALHIITGSSTAAHKAFDYVAVAVGQRSVTVLPVKFKTGLLGMSFKPVKGCEPKTYPREQVGVAVGQVGDLSHGRQAVPVRFTFPDGTVQDVEMYDNPQSWAPVARAQ